MKDWFADTLSKRLLLLMWLALVASHLIAFVVVSRMPFVQSRLPPGPAGQMVFENLPTFPSLPPTPGIPDSRPTPLPGPDTGPPDLPDPPDEARLPGDPPPAPPQRDGAPTLPSSALWLDYGVRFVVIAAAAWWGSRWLARPMQKLVQASSAMGASISDNTPLPAMDERAGTVEVREAAKVFNTMAGQLQEQFQARGLMVAAISHDLRTPLTRIRMRLESMNACAELQQRSIADIREMNDLIDNVLEVFRPGGAAGAEPFQQTDVRALAQSIVDDLAEQGNEVVVVDAGTPVHAIAKVQPDALRRVIDNVVGNALRYGTCAEVQVIAGNQQVCIVIDDSGPGIAAFELEAVFQPFYRVEASRNRHTGGAGLGLYIARDLVRRQGGSLSLTNRATGGLRAQITLPSAAPS